MVTEEKPIVQITADGMEAYIMLVTPDDGGEYTVESIDCPAEERGLLCDHFREQILRSMVG